MTSSRNHQNVNEVELEKALAVATRRTGLISLPTAVAALLILAKRGDKRMLANMAVAPAGAALMQHFVMPRVLKRKQLDPANEPEIVAAYEDAFEQSGLSRIPELIIIDDSVSQATALGLLPEFSVVAISRGIKESGMTHEEMVGVLAHELAHIKNRDLLVTSLTLAALSLVTSFVADIVTARLRKKSPLAAYAASMAFNVVPYLASKLILRAREDGADVTATDMTGNPQALAGALRKLARHRSDVPKERTNGLGLPSLPSLPLPEWLQTHSSIKQRIARLDRLTARG